jgi:hypothetical protein
MSKPGEETVREEFPSWLEMWTAYPVLFLSVGLGVYPPDGDRRLHSRGLAELGWQVSVERLRAAVAAAGV